MGIKRSWVRAVVLLCCCAVVLLVALCAGVCEAVSFQNDSYDVYESQNGTIYFLAKSKLLLIASQITIPISYKDGDSFYLNVASNTLHSLSSSPNMNGLSPLSGYDVYVGDINGDGWSDLYLHPLASGNHLFPFLGSSKIKGYLLFGGNGATPTQVEDFSWIDGHLLVDLTPVVSDYNGDGTADLVFVTESGDEIPRSFG